MTSETSPTPIDAELRLMVRAARMYYLDNLTQQEIGEALGFSRVKINRLLQRARELGLVKISIDAPDMHLIDQEEALVRRYRLRDAVVVPAAEPGEPLYLALAQGTAGWLMAHLRPGMRVGLGMGRTLSYLPRVFHPEGRLDVTFNEIIGGSAQNSGGLVTYNISSSMASLAGGRAEYIFAPTVLSSVESCRALLREPTVAEALEHARQADIILQSVGPVREDALLYVHGHLDQAGLADLRERGAVGDILGHYLDRNGRPVPIELEGRMIGLSLEDMRKIPFSVILAGGSEKIAILRAALLAGYANVLITDSATAQSLLKDEA